MKGSIRFWLEVLLAAAAVTFGFLFLQKIHETPPVGVPVEVGHAKEVAKVATEKIECTPIIVYKEAAKQKLNLPQSVQQDKAKVVVDATNVKPDIRSHTITTVLDTDTGETITYDTRNKLPMISIDTRGEAGLAYGYRSGEPTIRLEARQALFDIKAVKVGVIGSYDQPLGGGEPDAFIGVGAWYRW